MTAGAQAAALESTQYMGIDCIVLRNTAVELYVTRAVGPRVLYCAFPGEPNLFAELPEVTLDCPGSAEKFYAYGGHRLWHAPQVPARTHLPDNRPVTITPVPDGVLVVQPVEERTGIEKAMRITLPDDGAHVVIDHMLTNRGLWPVTTAPWAITELREGGVGVAPQAQSNDDPHGTWPNRSVALWPFTDMSSPHIHWGNRFVFVTATMAAGTAMLKIGLPNPLGWLAYGVDGRLFVKQAAYDPRREYFDRGSSSQLFCMPGFIELETQGPRTLLTPGATAIHREMWSLYRDVAVTADEDAAVALAARLRLAEGSNYL
jgi:hypothetical protein